ncbi:MAG: ATP-binding protein [Magnetococcales bacterium]|nr:ATP-binding protein [Magnetococcales bacterium]
MPAIRIRRSLSPERNPFCPQIDDPQALVWALRALTSTPAHREFFKDHSIQNEVLEWLGFRPLPDDFDKPVNNRAIMEQFRGALQRLDGRKFATSFVDLNVGWLGDMLELEPVEREILTLVVFCNTNHMFSGVLNLIGNELNNRDTCLWVAAILRRTPVEVRSALNSGSGLTDSGILKLNPFRNTIEDKFTVNKALAKALATEHDSAQAFLRCVLQQATPTDLSLDDYRHFADDLQILVPYLEHSLHHRTLGVNILLHGPPGTGKTALTKVLAHRLGAILYQVMDETSDGIAMGGDCRLNSFWLSQKLLRREQRKLLLFDEVEDVFPVNRSPFDYDGEHEQQKSRINRILETNPVPSFWISNEVGQIDPAFLRRFDLILEIGIPPQSVRRRIIDRYMGDFQVREQWVTHIARQEKLTPGYVKVAAKVAQAFRNEAGPRIEQVLTTVLANNLRSVGGRIPRVGNGIGEVVSYDPLVLNVDCDLGAVVQGLAQQRRGSLLLNGPPGTGKTNFAHNLAECLDRPLLVKKASDLLDKYLGNTEARIAQMFRDATQEGHLLFLDEADSLLQDRTRAEHSWEITQVNEILVQMEQFDGVFLCATNFREVLDRATLRRFDLKIDFGYLKPEQSLRLFRQVLTGFGVTVNDPECPPLRKRLASLTNLTPGDFATVVRKCRILGQTPTQSQVLTALIQECATKEDHPRPAIGFGV